MGKHNSPVWDPGRGYRRNRYIRGIGYRCNSAYRFFAEKSGCIVYRVYLRCKNKDQSGQQCPCSVVYDSHTWPDTPESITHFKTEVEHTCASGVGFAATSEIMPDANPPAADTPNLDPFDDDWDADAAQASSNLVAPKQVSVSTQCDPLALAVECHTPPPPDVDLSVLTDALIRYSLNLNNPHPLRLRALDFLTELRGKKKATPDDSSGSESDSSASDSPISAWTHRRKTGKIGKDIYVYYEYLTNGSSTSRILGTFVAQPLPQPCRLDDGQMGQLLMALDAIPFPSDPIWTSADGFAGSKYQVMDFLSRTDPRVDLLRDLVLKRICFPLHKILDRQYATPPLLECTLFGQEVGEADSTFPRYDNSFEPGTGQISAVFTLNGAGIFEFGIGRQVTSVNLDNEVLCLYPSNTLYRTKNTSGNSEPWIWGLVHLSHSTPGLSLDEGEFPAEGDPNIPEDWRPKHPKGKRASRVKPRAKRKFVSDDISISSRKK